MKNTHLSKKDIASLKSKLTKRKRKNEDELDTVLSLLKDQKEYIKNSDMTYDSDASKIRNREMLKNMKRRTKNKLGKIDSALKKIKKGNYGICEKSGKMISRERLMAMPEARMRIKR